MFLSHYTILAFAAAISLFSTASAKHAHLSTKRQHMNPYLVGHNAVRAAHGAQPLTWSYSLADSANQWASQCKLEHSGGALRPAPYGENIAAATGNFPVQAAIDLFVADASQYNPSDPTYNHFTQVVWKSTTQLGCSLALCNNLFNTTEMVSLYVCLYNPAGNVVGQALENVQV